MQSAMRGTLVNLQEAQTALGNGLVLAIPDSFKYHTFYIRGNGAVGAGAVQIETSSNGDYTDLWSPVTAAPTPVVANGETIVQLIGVFKFLRARISTVVTVGTVSVNYVGS